MLSERGFGGILGIMGIWGRAAGSGRQWETAVDSGWWVAGWGCVAGRVIWEERRGGRGEIGAGCWLPLEIRAED